VCLSLNGNNFCLTSKKPISLGKIVKQFLRFFFYSPPGISSKYKSADLPCRISDQDTHGFAFSVLFRFRYRKVYKNPKICSRLFQRKASRDGPHYFEKGYYFSFEILILATRQRPVSVGPDPTRKIPGPAQRSEFDRIRIRSAVQKVPTGIVFLFVEQSDYPFSLFCCS
jgi:hypothetical protein